MKFFLRAVAVITIMIAAKTGNAQVQQIDARQEVRLLLKTIQLNHYKPAPVNIALARMVFDNVIDDLDPDQLLFTQEDITLLGKYKAGLESDLSGKTWSFLPMLTSTYKKSLERAVINVQEITQLPISPAVRDILPRDTTWATSASALKERWRLLMKQQVLQAVLDMKTSTTQISSPDFVKAHEEGSRQRVKKNQLRKINHKLQPVLGFENSIATIFLGALANAFDAHTLYVSSREIENYMRGLTTEGYYFGFTLNEDENGNATIESLLPGSPAWKSGEMFVGDMLMRLRWEGHEWTEVAGIGLEEVNEILSDADQTAMYFELKNAAGVQRVVTLQKEKISTEENAVRSFVLNGERKIGYIALPGFYTGWGENDNSRCANDVAKEIIKLKQEKIEGIILDLRNNGGGSMDEAVAMAGIFIDGGPIGVLKTKAGELRTVKDMNRGTVYDGPLVIMVNGLSASASEFLAAALQDYHRAIIVGSRTFGKATAQIIYPIDPSAAPKTQLTKDTKMGTSYAFVTVEKLYRITGKTAQLKGVEPDILLPDYFEGLRIKEKHKPHAMVSDSVDKKTYYQPFLLLPITELRHKSETRRRGNAGFKAVSDYNAWLLEAQDNLQPITLNWSDVVEASEKKTKRYLAIEKELKAVTASFSAASFGAELRRMEVDAYVRDFNTLRIKNLNKDISLDEAFHIICDYITINNKK